jgi:hypothetical protein
MKPFLYELAEKLYREHPQPDAVTLVFPNRRAALFFRKYSAAIISKPTFSPTLITVEEFIAGFSALQIPDRLELVYKLYTTYRNVTGTEEPFDQFYFWGDMLVRDFDEADKYLVNTTLLFTDLSNQKEIDSRFDFLTPEQLEFLKDFWGNIDDTKVHKQKFLQLWRQLPLVHQSYRSQLLESGLAYEGMVHREVAEKMGRGEFGQTVNEHWFVGFNALTLAEEKIISHLVQHNQAQVHWDLDAYYLNNKTQEAGEFFRQYQNHPVLGKTFQTSAPAYFQQPKSVNVLGAAQPVGQAKLMAQILQQELAKGILPEETLIVLPDEKLLLPVLHGISGSVEKLNVTMGFALTSTPMFNLIELLVELQIHRQADTYNHRQVLALLGHPYVTVADATAANEKRKRIQKENWVMVPGSMLRTHHALHKTIFCAVNENGILDYVREVVQLVGGVNGVDELDKEYAMHFFRFLNRMEDILGKHYTDLKAFLRLFRQLIKGQKIPFTGEPLKGLQVMGVLETRNLDFKNVFMLSLNEGALPSGGGRGSYIPYNIRRAYALPTIEHQDSIYAYLFYRVLQRAENIFLFYNSETDVLGQGEMSRYLQQLLFESNLKPIRHVLHNPVQPLAVKPIQIAKNGAILEALSKLNEGNAYFQGISPSALNAYIECRLKFYFQHVAKIKEPNAVEEDIDARVMGNFLHHVMELFYKSIMERNKNNTIEAADLENSKAGVEGLIETVFRETYNLDPQKKMEFEGQRLVVREVVKHFALEIIKKDKAYAPFEIVALEKSGMTFRVAIDKAPGYAVIGGKIDRVDRKDNRIRIIDYKTGRDTLEFDSLASLFQRSEKRNKAAFQTILYAMLYQKSSSVNNETRLVPGLINRINLFDSDFNFGLTMAKTPITDVLPLLEEFEQHLKALLEELFNPDEPFDQTKVLKTCGYCAYKDICHR